MSCTHVILFYIIIMIIIITIIIEKLRWWDWFIAIQQAEQEHDHKVVC